MLKQNIAYAATVTVLLSGLISCSPEKKDRDVYAAPMPQIRSASGSLSLHEFNSQAHREVDWQDVVDVSAANPASIKVRTLCRFGEASAQTELVFAGRREVAFFELLPDEVLFEELKPGALECSFELNLYNEAGSNHIFNLAALPISEARPANVALADETSTAPAESMLRLSTLLDGVRYRFDNRVPASSQVICQDMQLPTMPFDQVAEMVHVNLKAPLLRVGREANTLEIRPQQYCRVVVSSAGRRLGVSSRFALILPRAPLDVKQTFAAPNCQEQNCESPMLLFARGKEQTYQTWDFTNNSPGAHWIRFSKLGALARVTFLLNYKRNPGEAERVGPIKVGTCDAHIAYLRPKAPLEQIVLEDATQTIVRIEVGQTIRVDATMWGRGDFRTPESKREIHLLTTPIEAPSYQELSENLEPLGESKLAIGSGLNFLPVNEKWMAQFPIVPEPGCSWK